MRVVTVCARDLTRALMPTLAILQRCHLIGNQRVVRHRIFDDTGACMTLRAWAHPFSNGQLLRIQYAEVSRMRARISRFKSMNSAASFISSDRSAGKGTA